MKLTSILILLLVSQCTFSQLHYNGETITKYNNDNLFVNNINSTQRSYPKTHKSMLFVGNTKQESLVFKDQSLYNKNINNFKYADYKYQTEYIDWNYVLYSTVVSAIFFTSVYGMAYLQNPESPALSIGQALSAGIIVGITFGLGNQYLPIF